MANSHRSHESNADEMHPIQTVTKIKMGTLAMHRSKKLYVHAIMKNEALLDAEMEWGTDDTIPEPNCSEKTRPEIKRQKAIKSGNKLAAICRIRSQKFAASCRLLSLALAAICRST